MTERFDPAGDVRGATGLWLKWEAAGVRTRRPLDRPLTIGRDAGCDICLTERTVSRHHAVVSVVSGRVHIDATTSTNGIKLKEGTTSRATLDVGGSFKIGDTTFSVVERSAADAGARPFAAPIAAQTAQERAAAAGELVKLKRQKVLRLFGPDIKERGFALRPEQERHQEHAGQRQE